MQLPITQVNANLLRIVKIPFSANHAPLRFTARELLGAEDRRRPLLGVPADLLQGQQKRELLCDAF